MGAATLSSRAIIGEFYRTLEQDAGQAWAPALSMLFTSDQDGETYPWLGQSPAMREWVGGRQAKGFIQNGIDIRNLHYEATIQFLLKDLRRDKTGQVMLRIQELADRTNSHWASLLSTLVLGGEATVGYDGQFFFDTDHVDPGADNQTAQSNDITLAIVAATNPTVAEFQKAIMKTVAQIQSFKDDRGEPMNENAQQFLVMVPTSLYIAANNALLTPREANQEVRLIPPNLSISVVSNARLTWTDKFATFRTDGRVKPFIRQQETEVMLKAKAEGSEFEFDHDAHQYGVDAWRNVGYGYWQHACLMTLTTI